MQKLSADLLLSLPRLWQSAVHLVMHGESWEVLKFLSFFSQLGGLSIVFRKKNGFDTVTFVSKGHRCLSHF